MRNFLFGTRFTFHASHTSATDSSFHALQDKSSNNALDINGTGIAEPNSKNETYLHIAADLCDADAIRSDPALHLSSPLHLLHPHPLHRQPPHPARPPLEPFPPAAAPRMSRALTASCARGAGGS